MATAGLSIRSNTADVSRRGIVDEDISSSRRRARWMTRAQGGDATAYRALLDDLGPVLTRFLRRRVRNIDDLADARQEAFLAIHRSRFTYQSSRPIEPWLFAIARNVVLDHGRRCQRRQRYELPADAAPEPAVATSWLDAKLELAMALRLLPNCQREAIHLLKLQELSVREAAVRVSTTPGAMKLRAHRGYRALRAIFET